MLLQIKFINQYFTGKKLYLTGVESEKDAELNEWINEAGGEVMSMEYEGPIDYLITGLTFDPMKTFKMKPSNIWTYLFLEDCLDQGKIAGLQYFHQPITIDPDLKPGKDLVIGITGYAGNVTRLSTIVEILKILIQKIY